MGGFCQELLSENNFEAILATFCQFGYGKNASEAVHNIATDQKDYPNAPQVLLNSQNISSNNSLKKGWLLALGHLQRS